MITRPTLWTRARGIRVSLKGETLRALAEARDLAADTLAIVNALPYAGATVSEQDFADYRDTARKQLIRAAALVEGPWHEYDEFVFAQACKTARSNALYCIERALGAMPEASLNVNIRKCERASAAIAALCRRAGL